MKMIKEFLDIAFWSIIIVLAFTIIVSIGTRIYKDIVVSSKIKKDSVCLEINNELYCRLDYDITFKYNGDDI